MKKLIAIMIMPFALGAAAMAQCGGSYYPPSYYGYGDGPVVVYPYDSGPSYGYYPRYRSYDYGHRRSYRYDHHYGSYGGHHGSSRGHRHHR